jgi:hypothetical protein
MGIAVLAAVFSAQGGYESPQAFIDGVVPALWIGSAVLALGAVAALAVPGLPSDLKRVRASNRAPVLES